MLVDGFWAGAFREGKVQELALLVERLGGPDAATGASRADLVAAGLRPEVATRWMDAEPVRSEGTILHWASEGYPERLMLSGSAPPLLFARGELSLLAGSVCGVVGTRTCTRYGRAVASDLACQVARTGVPVASGLARGIDGEAHRGSLQSGVTIAMLGHGLGHVSPSSHRGLRDDILRKGGLLLTGFADDAPPRRHTFLRRNVWLAGVCTHLVVVEAPRRSGAMHTARWAARFGRNVAVVPAQIGAPASEGCLHLLHEGADVVWSVPEWVQATFAAELDASAVPAWVVAWRSGLAMHEVARVAGCSVQELMQMMVRWELEGGLAVQASRS